MEEAIFNNFEGYAMCLIWVFLVGLVLAYFLIVWFETEAFVEYALLFRLNKIGNIFYLRDYKVLKMAGTDQGYLDYLAEFQSNFFTRLVRCPVCLSFWMGIFFVVLTSANWTLAPVYSVVGLFFYQIYRKISR